jgi:hypothetical protein
LRTDLLGFWPGMWVEIAGKRRSEATGRSKLSQEAV